MDNVGGSSCHAAAAIRCLASLRCARADIDRRGRLAASPAARALSAAIRGAGDGTGEPPDRAAAAAGFRDVLRLLGARGQQDAHETLASLSSAAGIDRRFAGALVARTACEACGRASAAPEPFSFLVSAGGGTGDLSDGLRALFSAETVRGYACDGCRAAPGACRVSRTVAAFPDALAVRCLWSGRPERTSAPLALDLSGCAEAPSAAPAYLLRSALLHSGTPSSGHYRALVVGRGDAPLIHDDGYSAPAPPGTLATDRQGRPRAVVLPGGQLHTALYEAAACPAPARSP